MKRCALIFGLALAACGKAEADPDPACPDPAWSPLGPAPAGNERSGHSAVWTGSELLVWGGVDAAGEPLSSGFRTDPLAGTIRAISEVGAARARSGHFAAWTGSRMVVWGGDAPGGDVLAPVKGGAVYDPSTDSWTPIAEAGGPGPRRCAAISWTERGLFVWGGMTGVGRGDPLLDGFIYDPQTELWTPITGTDAPDGNCAPTVIASGGSVLVFGGSSGGFEPAARNARYDLASDTWVATTDPLRAAAALDFPPPGFWTGTEAIFCGMNLDCYAYDPKRDTWRVLGGSGQPKPRLRAAWAFTGSKLVIFGGRATADDAALDDGASLDLDTERWSALPTTCSPGARYDSTLTWTETGAVLWGGRNDAITPTDSGWLIATKHLR